ncbi:MAG: nucleotide exchange factor GrpE [Acidobacteriales bacterium]|nr:nucleotide exchange factor GrpE [Terriglobales bacterium]
MTGSKIKIAVPIAENNPEAVQVQGDPHPPAPHDERDDTVKKLQAERDALFDRLARLQAEFDNYRKRAAKENADFRDFALSDTVKSLLPVLDNFELALRAPAREGDAELRRGVELIQKQFEGVLAHLGVTPIESVGRPFDPRWHEAIEMVPTAEVPDHQVLEELQRGYRLKDRLLRPARVRVAQSVN